MKNAGTYQDVLRAARNARRGMPQRFAEIEEMTEPWMEFYITAFFEVITERPTGFAIMPVPWSKIRLHGEAYGLRDEPLQIFHHIIRTMDDHLVGVMNKKARNGDTGPIRKADEAAGKASGDTRP